jgi:hypothetical protein
MKRLEPGTPRPDPARTALAAAPCRRAPFLLLCVLLAGLGPPSAASAAPEPDGAPHPTQPAPDPAPGAGGVSARPTQPAPTTSTPTTSPSPPAPTSATPTPPTPAQPTTSSPTLVAPADASNDRWAARSRRAAKRRAAARERARRVEAAERARARVAARRQLAAADSLLPTQLQALVPSSATDDTGSGHLLFLAACALLALLCASASFLSVATRISRGQLR